MEASEMTRAPVRPTTTIVGKAQEVGDSRSLAFPTDSWARRVAWDWATNAMHAKTFNTVQTRKLTSNGRRTKTANKGSAVGGLRKGCSAKRSAAYGSKPAQTSCPTCQKIL